MEGLHVVYVGNVSSTTSPKAIEDLFTKFESFASCEMKSGGFGFVKFEKSADAEDAIAQFDGYEVDGNKLKVQHGKSQAGRRGDNRGGYDGGQGPRGPRPTGQNRVYVDGVDSKISWQDLKDFARKAGNPAFTEVMEDTKGKYGVIEYRTAEDCYSACRMLDGTMIGNCKVRVYEANGSSSGGGSKGGGYPRERSAGRSGGSDRYDDRGPRGDRRDYPPERYDRGPGDRYGDRYPPGGRSDNRPPMDRGGYDRGGYDRGGNDRGGYDRGGYDRGGYDRGAPPRGGPDRYDRSGYDRGGHDRGGYDRGGPDRGGPPMRGGGGYDRPPVGGGRTRSRSPRQRSPPRRGPSPARRSPRRGGSEPR